MSEKPVLHLRGVVVIEEDGEKVQTTIMGERWHLYIEGEPATLRDGAPVVVKIFLEEE